MTFDNLPSSIQHIKAGKLRALAVTTAAAFARIAGRADRRRNGPGLRGERVLRPRRAEGHAEGRIVDLLNKQVNLALKDPGHAEAFKELGGIPIPGTPEDFGKIVAEETAKWEKVVQRRQSVGRTNGAHRRSRMTSRKRPEELRSHRWLGVSDLRSFGHRSRLRQGGFDADDWAGKPVIGIINTWSDINFCHTHLRERAEDVKRGVLQAGGFPVELPAMSLSEPFVKPSTMLYRNLLAMETEELLRSHPIDGAVLMGGCDKTTPGADHGRDQHGYSGDLCAGRSAAARQLARPIARLRLRRLEILGREARRQASATRTGPRSRAGIARSFGTCMVMGTAATMMAIAEALGMSLPGASSIPAADSGHPRMCSASGRRIVDMVWEDLTPAKILTPAAFDNAIRVHMAMGGSTNAIIHVVAMARRAGIPLDMKRFDEISREVPVLANVRPSGEYLMEDFYYAGGLRALMDELKRSARPDLPHGHRQDARREHRRR